MLRNRVGGKKKTEKRLSKMQSENPLFLHFSIHPFGGDPKEITPYSVVSSNICNSFIS